MPRDLNLIQQFVGALVRRERRLIASTAAVRVAVLAALLVVLSVVAARGHWDRSTVLMGLVAVTAAGLWAAVWVPLLTRWRPAGDPMRQARQVEALKPALRGRLLTAVGHVGGAQANESEALLGLVARRAAEAVATVPPSRVHPFGHVWRTLVLAAACWLIALPATLLAPGGPAGLLRFWGSGLDARAAAAALQVAVQEDFARVGDLTITYTYPEYTGLEPHQVQNTTGDVSGPPGTVVEVSARTADPVEAAGLMAYDKTFEASVSDRGRVLGARFAIGAEEGIWRLLLYRGGEPEKSAGFSIAPEPDLPPEVMLESDPPVLEVAVDEPFTLQWRARDDYGVRRAALTIDAGSEERVLYEAESRRAEAFDQLFLRPSELGLAPGADVELRVVAWDNDTVAGSKAGSSQPVRLVVLGAMGQDARRAERHDELEKLMVPILARFLTEDWPPGDSGAKIVRWGEKVAKRYQPVQELVDQQWRGMSDEALDRAFVNKVLTTGRDLVRYTQVAFQAEGNSRPSAVDMVQVQEMRDKAVVALERALLAFIKERQARALAELYSKAEELKGAAELLDEALSRENPDKLELLARLDQLERLFQQMQDLAAKLSDGGLKAFVNQRDSEIQGLMDEVRDAIAEGRLDDAKRLMERLAEQIRDMAAGIEHDLQERTSQSEDAQGQARELADELQAIEAEQRDLQQQVRALREREDSEGAEDAAALWQRVDKLVEEVVRTSDAYRTQLQDADRPFYEQERALAGVEAIDVLRAATRARDIRGSREAVVEAGHHWMVVQRTAFGLYERRADPEGPRPEVAGVIERKLHEIEVILDALDQASDGLSREALDQAEQIRDRQRDLENRLEQAREQVGEVMQKLPVEPEGMPEALEEASERMDQASDDLGQGRAMAAEGSQGVAAERIRKARSALEQAMRAGEQIGQGGGNGKEERDGQGGEQGDKPGGDQLSGQDIYIPGREAYESPEAYRKALLEGMQGDVPDAYRAWKKRYYEELVQQ